MSRKVIAFAAFFTAALVSIGAVTVQGLAAPSKAAKTLHFALVTGDNHDPFYVTMNAGAQAEARKLGVTVRWQGPTDFQPQLQIPVLDSVLATRPNFLLVAPTDVKALIAPLKKFKSSHVPIVT